MAPPSDTVPHMKPRSFDPPQEPEWHRMIAEAAYFIAEKRGFVGEHSLDDWLTAERQVRQVISPDFASTERRTTRTTFATGRPS
jgi:hypothetical protein